MESAEKIFHNMLDRGVRPDTVSYNTLLSGYVVQGDVRKAFQCFNNVCCQRVNIISVYWLFYS